jgi:dolichol-phosphate mannosyltransferase
MVDRWLAGIKYVLCRRTDRDDPVTSKVFSYLYYWLIRMFVIPDFPKGGYDLALMDRSLLPHLQRSSKNINPAILAYWLGFKPDVLEYCRQRRTHGRSRWTLAKKAVYFIDSILGFSVLPIRLISALGFAASSISLGYGVLVVVSAALGHGKVQGFPTLVALVTFLLGLIIIMLGIIGEYLWRVFDEVNARPETVIDEIY